MEEEMKQLRSLLKRATSISENLFKQGVELTFEVGSDVKTVEVTAKTHIEISVKGKIDKEL
jgi:hypothetical protein